MKKAAPIFILAIAVLAWNFPFHETEPSPPSASWPSAGVNTHAPAQTAAVIPAQSLRRETASVRADIESFLKGKSPASGILVTRDESGDPIRVTGLKIPGILDDVSAAQSFAIDLARATGIRAPLTFKSSEIGTGALKVLQLEQTFSPNGRDEYPVFQASIRLIGAAGTVSIIQPQLKDIDQTRRINKELSVEDALEIARKSLNDPAYQVELESSQPFVVYADRAPHQLVTRVLTRGKSPEKLLLIGHSTRTVVEEFNLNRH